MEKGRCLWGNTFSFGGVGQDPVEEKNLKAKLRPRKVSKNLEEEKISTEIFDQISAFSRTCHLIGILPVIVV
jgi:hypothetical protein